jgi:hypothetical protein
LSTSGSSGKRGSFGNEVVVVVVVEAAGSVAGEESEERGTSVFMPS